MSQENVEIVRLGFEALNAGEPDFSIFDPALVYHPRTDEPDPSAHVGRDAFERLLVGFLESFRDLRFDVLELIDAGGDRVIVSTTMHGRGAASGASVDDTYVFVYELRDGLVVEGWEYRTRQEALEAAGLSEYATRAQIASQFGTPLLVLVRALRAGAKKRRTTARVALRDSWS